MKSGARALVALGSAWLACACALAPASDPDAASAAIQSESVESADRRPVPLMLRIPPWVQPAPVDFERAAGLHAAVAAAERGDDVGAAVRLRELREAGLASPRVCALYAWVLRAAASNAEAERAARADLQRFGAGSAALNYALAVILETEGRAAEASACYRMVLASDPNDLAMLRACARTTLAGDQPRAALPHLELLAETSAGDPQLLVDLATAVHADAQAAGGEERRARARGLLHEVLLLDPQHAAAQRMLGESLAASGEQEAAVAALRRALELEPGAVSAGQLLARLLHERGRRADAIAVLRELLRQPLAPEAVRSLRDQIRILEEA